MRFTFCLATALTLSLLTVPGLSNAWAADAAVMLNPHVVLTKDVLTVADLFEPAGPSGDHVLAMAPAAGHDMTLSASDLQRVADSFHLEWHSDDPNLTATIERDAVRVTPDMLAKALTVSKLDGKLDDNAADDAEIAVLSPVDGIVMTGQALPDIAFENVAYDAAKQTFSATALLSRDGKTPQRTAVSGVATRMVDVPVLTAAIDRGLVIGQSDVTTIRVPANSVKAATVAHASDLVGMVTRRALDPQKILSRNDLVPPVLVRRNEIVTVTYKNGSMQLTTKARALANGVKGEIVRLENPSSKKMIEATVTGPQQTVISADDAVTING